PTVASPRQSAANSSASALASSRPSRWTASARRLPRSAMRTRATALATALPLRFGLRRDALDGIDRRQVGGRRRGCGLLRLLEDRLGCPAVAVRSHLFAPR